MPHAYTEDQLVEQPASDGLFAVVVWQSVPAMEDIPDGTLGCETMGDVVHARNSRTASPQLNQSLFEEAIENTMNDVVRSVFETDQHCRH